MLQAVVRTCCARPALTILVAVLAAAAGVGYAAHALTLETSKFHLLPLHQRYATLYKDITGFGSLLVAQHQGVFSLGLLLVIGSAMTLAASLVVLPTLVRLGGERMRSPAEARDPATVIVGRHPARDALSRRAL